MNGDATGTDQGARAIAVADKVLPAGVAGLRIQGELTSATGSSVRFERRRTRRKR